MKKIMLMAALMAAMTHAQAQKVVEETDLKETEETVGQTETGDDGVKQSPSTGDLFDGQDKISFVRYHSIGIFRDRHSAFYAYTLHDVYYCSVYADYFGYFYNSGIYEFF